MTGTLKKQLGIFCALTVILFPATASRTRAAEKSSKVKWYAEFGYEHSDNVFHLSELQEAALEDEKHTTADTHHYEDMASISDTVLTPKIGFKYKTESPLGGKFGLDARVAYNFYTENKELNYPEAKIALTQDIGKKGTLSLESDFLFDFFKKNYLSNIDDENENGNITKEERIYSSASYDEHESILSYEHELLDNKGELLSGLDIRPFIGYGRRTYNSLFSNRDREISIGGLGLVFEFMSRLDLEATYTYENVRSPNNSELVLFDETIDDTDVNDDGEIKENAALTTRIDRSSDRYTVAISPSLKLSKDIKLFAEYKKRTTEYRSNNPLDIDHYKQTAYREKIGFGVQYDFMKSWTAEAKYKKTDEDDEDDDYTENSFCFLLKHSF